MTQREFDPLGRAALFLPPQADAVARPEKQGRKALFSAGQRSRRSVVVECGGCGARTPMGPVELPARLFPSVWVPLRRFNRWMRCPSCRRPTWCRIAWRA